MPRIIAATMLTLALIGAPTAAHADERDKNVHCKALATMTTVETMQKPGFVRAWRVITTTTERCRGKISTVTVVGAWSMVNPTP